jgi:prolipoprotein diacylglyceryltransferase
LYESIASIVIFVLLVWVIAPRLPRVGGLLWAYMVLAGVERFMVEFVRTNPQVLLGLTQQQWISIGLIVVGLLGVWWVEYGPRNAGAERAAGGRGSAQASAKVSKKSSSGAARGKRTGSR